MFLNEFRQTLVENTGITNCQKCKPEELLVKAVDIADRTVGELDREVDDVAIISQTGHMAFEDGFEEEIVAELRARGIKINGFVSSQLAYSNSQPNIAREAEDVEREKGRNLVLAVEPLNTWRGKDRSKRISQGVLDDRPEVESMLDGLDKLTAAYQKRFDISPKEMREALRHLALYLHSRKSGNPSSHRTTEITGEKYDDHGENKILTENLTLFDTCPTTDRAAAIVLTHEDRIIDTRNAIRYVLHATSEDQRGMEDRLRFEDYPEREALFEAAEAIFSSSVAKERGITRERVANQGIIEIHNAVSPLVIMALIEMGLMDDPKKQIRKLLESDLKRINPSGGLLAGHPLAATAPSILDFNRRQLLGKAGANQVEGANIAVQQNVWGLRDAMSVSVFEPYIQN